MMSPPEDPDHLFPTPGSFRHSSWLRKQVGIWAKTCLCCQTAKVHRHTMASWASSLASHRFDHIHVDLVALLPYSHNYRYLLTVVDRFIRWLEAIPMADAQTTHWISRFGVPTELTSDRGSQFTSGLLWQSYLNYTVLVFI